MATQRGKLKPRSSRCSGSRPRHSAGGTAIPLAADRGPPTPLFVQPDVLETQIVVLAVIVRDVVAHIGLPAIGGDVGDDDRSGGIVDQDALIDPPKKNEPEFGGMPGGWSIVSWSDDRMSYLLATTSGQDALKQLL